MKTPKSSTVMTFAALSALFCAGCVLPSTAVMVPSSKFVYPNSNVIPLGEASGSHSKLCGILFVNWGAPDGDDQMEATQDALEEKHGANLLIDIRTSSSIFSVPMLFSICSTSVTGTAAKMEVGRQILVGAPKKARRACGQDSDCKEGSSCVDGECKAAPRAAAKCSVDKDCPGELICNEGACVAPRSP